MNYGELIGAGACLLPAAIFFLWQYKKTKKNLFAIAGLISSACLVTSFISALGGKTDGTYIDAYINRHLSDWYIASLDQGKCIHITDIGSIYNPDEFKKKFSCKNVPIFTQKEIKIVQLDCTSRLNSDYFFVKGKKRCLTFESKVAQVIKQ